MLSLIVSVAVSNDRPNGEIQARSTLRNLQALPRFQRLCERYGIMPTYFLAYPTLKSPHVEWFQQTKKASLCDLGILFQPWSTPPFEANESRLKRTTPAQCAPSTIRSKLEHLCQHFENQFGFKPRQHRAEGGGLSGACLQSLEGLGLTVDASGFPGLGARDGLGFDWGAAPRVAYHPSRQSPDQRGQSRIIEIPYTTGPAHAQLGLLRQVTARFPRWVPIDSMMSHILLNTEQCVLDPAEADMHQLRTIADVNVGAGLPYLHCTVRSENLHPGESLKTPDTDAMEKLFEKMDQLFRYAVDTLRAIPVPLAGYAHEHHQPGDA